jgi:hypothetical protein
MLSINTHKLNEGLDKNAKHTHFVRDRFPAARPSRDRERSAQRRWARPNAVRPYTARENSCQKEPGFTVWPYRGPEPQTKRLARAGLVPTSANLRHNFPLRSPSPHPTSWRCPVRGIRRVTGEVEATANAGRRILTFFRAIGPDPTVGRWSTVWGFTVN